MPFQTGETSRCPDSKCVCEIQVTKGEAPGQGGDQKPRCCCGKEMELVKVTWLVQAAGALPAECANGFYGRRRMPRRLVSATLVAVPLAIGGFVLAGSRAEPAAEPAQKASPVVQVQAEERGYVCPVTGDELPCPKCCPLNQE